jgi:O-antigen/teichoic acid export membrane protein
MKLKKRCSTDFHLEAPVGVSSEECPLYIKLSNLHTYLKLFFKRVFKTALIWAFLVTVLRAAGFFLVMAYALRTLSSSEIGLWYVMLNIAGLAGMVEFGFNITIGRFASFFMGGSERVPPLGLNLCPDSLAVQPNYRAVAGLIVMARPIYVRFGIFMMLAMLMGGGFWLASAFGDPKLMQKNAIAFCVLALGSGLNMMVMFWQGLQFGINRVRAYNQFFIVGLLFSYAFSFCGLIAGMGLTALVFGLLILNFTCRWLARQDVLNIIPETAFKNLKPVTWQELWPMTWRSGVASWSAFLCIQNTTLICSLVNDIDTTASYGFSLQLALILHGFSANWLLVKYPLISNLRVQGAVKEMVSIIWKRMLLSLITFAAGSVVIILTAPLVLSYVHSKTQVLPNGQMIALFFVIGLDLIVGMHAAMMQTGNQVPHLKPFGLSGILVTLLGWFLGRSYGIYGLITAVALSQLIYNYWWTPWRCWHDLSKEILEMKALARLGSTNSV